MKVQHLYRYDVTPGGLFAIPDVPESVMYDLTTQCNQSCRFCYNPSSHPEVTEPDLETQLGIVSSLGRWGVQEILYLGGEPTLCPHLEPVLETAAGFGMRQRLVTNGQRMPKRLAQRLAYFQVEVGVSFCGAGAVIHDDLVQNRGSFEAAMAAIDRLTEAGCSAFVHYSPTAVHSAGELFRFSEVLRDRFGGGIRKLDVNRLLPQGQASGAENELLLGPYGWWAALLDALAVSEAGWEVHVESVPRCWTRSQAKREGLSERSLLKVQSMLRPCRMAVVQLALDPWGRVKLCPGGKAMPATLPLDHPREFWKGSALLQSYRRSSWLPRSCVDYSLPRICPDFHACAGGCRSATSLPPDADPLILS